MVNDWTNLQPLLTGGVAAALLLMGVVISLPTVRRVWADRRIRRLIGRLGAARVEKAVLPDGLGGFVYIEQLLLTGEGALLVGVKPYRGTIFAAENIDHWTQVLGRRSFKFANPLEQLESDAQAIRGLFPQMPLKARVVFSKDSAFPKGKPEAVWSYEELREQARTAASSAVPAALQKQWQQLVASVQPASKHERRLMSERISPVPVFVAIALLLSCVAWVLWRLQWPAGLWS